MSTVSELLFDTTILVRPSVRATAAKAARKVPTVRIQPMPSSLWRHTQNEDATQTSHGFMARAIFTVIGALGLGSVGYAIWQSCALMSGSGLHDAVAAFMH